MTALYLILGFLLQAPATAPVTVGLLDGQKLALDNPHYTGFIETRDGGDVLLYRQKDLHGQLNLSLIQRIDFNYKKGKPFELALTLKNGNKMNVQSDKREYIILKGVTETGSVTIKNPDPTAAIVRLSTKKPNRKHDLTIQYLEFPR